MPYTGTWLIATNRVIVTADTELSGMTPQVGLKGVVQGRFSITGIQADKITVIAPTFTFDGYISQIPAAPYIGDWVVGHRIFPVTADTVLLGETPEVGQNGFVTGYYLAGVLIVTQVTVVEYYQSVEFNGFIEALP